MAQIKSLNLINFKSYSSFNKVINSKNIVLTGPNGSGKTNILEALSFFSNSKGLRSEKLNNQIKKNSNGKAVVNINLESNKLDYKLTYEVININNEIKKKFKSDEKNISQNLITKIIKFIWLSPSMDNIMYEGKSIKRKFLDKLISQYNLKFVTALNEYKTLSNERIKLLNEKKNDSWLNILESKISKILYDIYIARRSYATLINEISAQELFNFRKFIIKYKLPFEAEIKNKEICLKIIEKTILNNRSIDSLSKRNTFGINSDDISFFDIIKKSSSDLLSTGEQKSILLSIILSNCHLYKKNNQNFIMLFDEISSHIDVNNMRKFFAEIDKFDTQTWYTGTDKILFQAIENKAFFIDIG